MTWIQIALLAVLQGLTEFLPISSSAHLILVPRFLGWEDQGLAFDVAVHVGTLAAIVLHFRGEIVRLFLAVVGGPKGAFDPRERRLAFAIAIGTVPLVIAGLLFHDAVETMRNFEVIALTTILFGIVLGVADRKGRGARDEHSLRWWEVLIVGLAQAVAIIPGTSRSGITMTAALFLGTSRNASARLSFLLSIPAILGAGGKETLDLIQAGTTAADWQALVIGAFLSGVSAWICIRLFLRFLERVGFLPFVVYRLVLGAVLIAIILSA